MRTILDVRSDHFLGSEDWLCNLTGFGRVTSEGSKKNTVNIPVFI